MFKLFSNAVKQPGQKVLAKKYNPLYFHNNGYTAQNTPEYGFSLTSIFAYKDRI